MKTEKFLAALSAKVCSLGQVSIAKYKALLISQGFDILLCSRSGLPGQVGDCKMIVQKDGRKFTTSLSGVVII